MPSQFGITTQQLESVIVEYQSTFTSLLVKVFWIRAAVTALLAWFTLGKSKS